MIYKFDSTDIRTFGATPIIGEGAIELEGVYDLPKRTGETEYNWGTEIEPYVSPDEITLDGRKLTLNVLMKGGDLNIFKLACVNLRALGTEFGDFDVLAKDEISVEEWPGVAHFEIPLWQDVFTLPPLTVTGTEGKGFLMDTFNLEKDFGIVVSSRKDNNTVGRRIEANTTDLYRQTKYRDNADIILSCFMPGVSWIELHGRMMQFYALCMLPGMRTLRFPDNSTHDIYIKDGMTVRTNRGCILTFDLKMRVI